MLETSQGLEIDHPVLQEANLFQVMVNMLVCCFPLFGEDDVVIFDGILDHVGCRQNLLLMLLGIGLDMMDLCCMGSPFHLSIVHL